MSTGLPIRNRPQLPLADIAEAGLSLFGIEGVLEEFDSERDQTLRLCSQGDDYVVKVLNIEVQRSTAEFQAGALRHIERTDPTLRVPRVRPTLSGRSYGEVAGPGGAQHLVQVFDWLPGRPLGAGTVSPSVRRSAGAMCARLHRSLWGFHHPAAGAHAVWDVRRIRELESELQFIADSDTRAAVGTVIRRCGETVIPGLDSLPSQVIHNDVNRHNLLVASCDSETVEAAIDFGDIMHGPRAVDLSIACASLIRGADDPVRAFQETVIGYDAVLGLESAEIACLPDLVLARLASLITVSASRSARSPSEPSYRVHASSEAAALLDALLTVGGPRLRGALQAACGASQTPDSSSGRAAGEALLQRRRQVLGSNMRTFYPEDPLWLAHGRDVWVYDHGGRRYLDAYNNVPHVGHAHPRVVRAVSRQAGQLNISARYLFPTIVEYAERLVGISADGLDTCFLVNSGSEANDLAWQMATLATNRRGALIMSDAYHGITLATRRLSQRSVGEPLAPWVVSLPVPDPQGSSRPDAAEPGRQPSDDVAHAVETLARAGHAPAALIVDTGFGSNGIPSLPDGYLAAVCAAVRANGGLVIADEVQMGLGRSGSHWWGYECHGIVPDIVTAGKPLGNGFPLGAVIAPREIRERLSVFSTFGGNPVACAAGLATLDVITDEGLVENADRTGAYLRERLAALAHAHPAIVDVRGRGLMIGVEIDDPRTRSPDGKTARAVVERMRRAGVLIGRTGPDKNVLKIRPPLTFRPSHADLLVNALGRSVTAT